MVERQKFRHCPVSLSQVETTGLESIQGCLPVPVFEEDVAARGGPLAALDRALGGQLSAAVKEERFRGRAESTLLLHSLGRLPARRRPRGRRRSVDRGKCGPDIEPRK